MRVRTGCNITSPEEEGALRLRGGFGSRCDLMNTGFVEVFHNSEWGAIARFGTTTLVPDVVCRQLGFLHGTALLPGGNPSMPVPRRSTNCDYDYDSYDDDCDYYNIFLSDYRRERRMIYIEEALPPVDVVWLDGSTTPECFGPEERLVDCDLGLGVTDGTSPRLNRGRLTVACRQFAVEAAMEAVTTPGAGVTLRVWWRLEITNHFFPMDTLLSHLQPLLLILPVYIRPYAACLIVLPVRQRQ